MFKYVKKCKFLLVAKLFLFLLTSCSVNGDIDVLDLEQLQIFDFPSPVMKVVYDGVEKQGEDTIDFGVCNEELVKEVKVFNVWCDTLLLQDVAIESDGSFMLKHSVRGVLIAPGESYRNCLHPSTQFFWSFDAACKYNGTYTCISTNTRV